MFLKHYDLFFASTFSFCFSNTYYLIIFFRLSVLKLPKGITIKRVTTTKSNETADSLEEELEESETGDENYETSSSKRRKKYTKSGFVKVRNINYLCLMCETSFSNFDELQQHVNSEVPCAVVLISCSICGKQFTKRSACSNHVRTHLEKPVRYIYY